MEDGTGDFLRHICGTDVAREIRNTLDLVGDKWSLMAVGLLESGPLRFSQLRRELPGISQRMLTRTLRRLERDGLVSRTVYPTNPPSVEYALTPLGQSLPVAIRPLTEWAAAHHQALSEARGTYDEASQRSAAVAD
jgi:DNA-binding HxlR family transcriptional regulator